VRCDDSLESSSAILAFQFGGWEGGIVTRAEISILVEKAKRITMSATEREQQRRSFAFGNANIENEAVTRDVIDEVAERMAKEPTVNDLISENPRDVTRGQ
jgi:hypothetical protein